MSQVKGPSFEDADISHEIVERKRAYDGRFLKVDTARVKFPDGRESTHEVIDHPGAVGLIVIDDQDRILLERQYRTALDEIIVEIPAGKLEIGEDPLEAAGRELIEETGYRAGGFEHAFSFVPAAGYSNEVLHVYVANDIAAGDAQPDEDEFIITFWMPVSEFIDAILDGDIQDSKTVICGLWLARKRFSSKLD